ncbi:MAG TPA: hypothetical protein DCZ95_10890 [Verrucomicrobia bacterium]|nr:MAG: hypothetical protein A2X46_08100 [Lentisphaerae bacterium GWF2_57_35]HBA84590.1 hypothetical protein [Verrucomicrobiota bacterium]
MTKSWTALLHLPVWVLIGACTFMGCETLENDPADADAAGTDQTGAKTDPQTTTPSNTTTPTTPSTAPTNTTSLTAGRQVSGSTADKSRESDNRDNETMWMGGPSKMNVRCLANDEKTKGMGGDYFCSEVVTETESLVMFVNTDGTITAIANDFVSPRSGLVYKFKGYTAVKSASGLITKNPYTVSKSEQAGVFRAYWNTYQR